MPTLLNKIFRKVAARINGVPSKTGDAHRDGRDEFVREQNRINEIAGYDLIMRNQSNKAASGNINITNPFRSSIIHSDELPTIFIKRIDSLIATAHSNKVAIVLGTQDKSPLRHNCGEKKETVTLPYFPTIHPRESMCRKCAVPTPQVENKRQDKKTDNFDNDLDLIIPDLPECPMKKYGDIDAAESKPRKRGRKPKAPAKQTLPVYESADRERDEWELGRRDLFENEDRFRYYSEFVDNYVESHGLRGIKDRNVILLRELNKAGSTEEEEWLIWKLIDNNRPIIKRAAMRQCHFEGWSDEDMRDAYGDAIVFLAESYKRNIAALKTYDVKQLNTMNYWYTKASCSSYGKRLKRDRDSGLSDFVPLNEESAEICESQETYLNLNAEYLADIMQILTLRERFVFKTYFFGDAELGITGLSGGAENVEACEAIADALDLTRERVRVIKEKALRKIRNFCIRRDCKDILFSNDTQYKRQYQKFNRNLI